MLKLYLAPHRVQSNEPLLVGFPMLLLVDRTGSEVLIRFGGCKLGVALKAAGSPTRVAVIAFGVSGLLVHEDVSLEDDADILSLGISVLVFGRGRSLVADRLAEACGLRIPFPCFGGSRGIGNDEIGLSSFAERGVLELLEPCPSCFGVPLYCGSECRALVVALTVVNLSLFAVSSLHL